MGTKHGLPDFKLGSRDKGIPVQHGVNSWLKETPRLSDPTSDDDGVQVEQCRRLHHGEAQRFSSLPKYPTGILIACFG